MNRRTWKKWCKGSTKLGVFPRVCKQSGKWTWSLINNMHWDHALSSQCPHPNSNVSFVWTNINNSIVCPKRKKIKNWRWRWRWWAQHHEDHARNQTKHEICISAPNNMHVFVRVYIYVFKKACEMWGMLVITKGLVVVIS